MKKVRPEPILAPSNMFDYKTKDACINCRLQFPKHLYRLCPVCNYPVRTKARKGSAQERDAMYKDKRY